MKNHCKFDISFVLLMLSVAFGMYFCQGIIIIESDPRRAFTLAEIFPLFFITLVPTIIYYILKFKNKEIFTKFDLVVFVLFCFLFLLNIQTVLFLPNGVSKFGFPKSLDDRYVFNYSSSEKIYSILGWLISLVTGYLMLCELPKRMRSKTHVAFWFIVCMIASVIFLLVSYAVNFEKYIAFIKNPSSGIITIGFIEKSNLAVWLFYMVFGCLYCNETKKSWAWYALACFFALNIVFTESKINMAMVAILIPAYLIFRLIYTYKENRIRNRNIFLVIGLVVLLVLVGFLVFGSKEGTIFYRIAERAKYLLSWTKVTTGTRKEIWQNCMDIFANSHWIFGMGFSIFNKILLVYRTNADSWDIVTDLPHNAFLEYLGVGGIFLTLIMIGLFIYTIVVLFKIRKEHPSLSFLSLLTWALYFVHMTFDTNTPILLTSTPIIDTLFLAFVLFIPGLSIHYHSNHKEDNKELIESEESVADETLKQENKGKVFMLIASLISCSVIPAIVVYFKDLGTIFAVGLIVPSLTIMVLPLLKKEFRNKDFIKNVLIKFVVLSISISFISSIYWSLVTPKTYALNWIIFAFSFTTYFFALFVLKPLKSLANPLSIVFFNCNKLIINLERKGLKHEVD